MQRRDLGEFPLAEGWLQFVVDQQVVLLAGAGPNVGALGQPKVGVSAKRDSPEFRVDPVAAPDRGRDGVKEGVGIGFLNKGLEALCDAGLRANSWPESSHWAVVARCRSGVGLVSLLHLPKSELPEPGGERRRNPHVAEPQATLRWGQGYLPAAGRSREAAPVPPAAGRATHRARRDQTSRTCQL